MGALDVGYKAGTSSISQLKPKVLFLLGADESRISSNDLSNNSFVIYQGHHGDQGAELADVVLPGAAYTEKNATYVNTEGRVQHTEFVVAPPGKAKEDWQIIRALSEVLGSPLPYDDLNKIRERMAQISPSLVQPGQAPVAGFHQQAVESAHVLFQSF